MSVIGLDIGTTRIKAVLHDLARDDVPVVAVSTPVIRSPHGDLRDAEAVTRAAIDCISRLVEGITQADRARIVGIGIASLSEEVVLRDEQGRSVAPLPTWYATVAGDASARAGLNPSFSWAKLRWAREHLPSDAVDAVRGFTSLAGHIASRLTGGAAPTMEHSHASRTGFFQLEESCWDEGVFESTGWPADLLPPLVTSGTSSGRVDRELCEWWRIPRDTAVAVAGHDHLCAAFAAGVRRPGQIFLSSGTSEAHVLLLDEIAGVELPAHVQVGRFVDGRSFYLHAHLPSGHLHAHLEQLVGGGARLADLERQALAEPVGASGFEFVPRVGADPGYSVRGMSAHAGPAAFIRAAQEGLSLAARDLDESLLRLGRTSATTVVATGAATANSLWLRIRGAVGVAPVEVVEEQELTALGAAHVFRYAVLSQDVVPARHRRIEVDGNDVRSYERLRAARASARVGREQRVKGAL